MGEIVRDFKAEGVVGWTYPLGRPMFREVSDVRWLWAFYRAHRFVAIITSFSSDMTRICHALVIPPSCCIRSSSLIARRHANTACTGQAEEGNSVCRSCTFMAIILEHWCPNLTLDEVIK